jgi:serine/threonine-protein kinase HipA
MVVSSVPDRLRVVVSGRPAGWLRRDRSGRVTLRYDDDYAADLASTPLSVGLPLDPPEHAGRRLDSWLANLLPDNALVLDRWAARFHVSARSPFSLLAHVGTDCAGAAQFLPPEYADQADDGGLVRLSEAQVADRLARLREEPAAWTPEHQEGQFSLAGAQPKLALRLDDDGWAEPWGAEPTSHILKPPMVHLDHQELNEHLCLCTANRIGIDAARSGVASFVDERAVVITRYDRVTVSGTLRRAHQEDMCQAFGVPPGRKYQTDGGPSPHGIVGLLRSVVTTDAEVDAYAFVSSLAFSWVIAATDAHAKNYSLLLGGESVRLAPLYDVNSVLPYLQRTLPRPRPSVGRVSAADARLAMTIGGKARLDEIDDRAWRAFAANAHLDADRVLDLVTRVLDTTPSVFDDIVADEIGSGRLSDAQVDFARRLADLVRRRAASCWHALAGRGTVRRRHRDEDAEAARVRRSGGERDSRSRR